MPRYNALTKFIIKRPSLVKIFAPLSIWYAKKMGYQQLGLKMEDLLPEEDEITQLALARLPPKEAYDRVFRLRRAFQLSLQHQILPEEEWTKFEDDNPYLSPLIEEIEEEMKEREDLESMAIRKNKK